ncbi:hypothetical protein BH09PSE4_BH09PSE4_19580 [soil metagenome]
MGLGLLAAAMPAFAASVFISCDNDRAFEDGAEKPFFDNPVLDPFILKIDDGNVFLWNSGWMDDLCVLPKFSNSISGEHGQCTETVNSRTITIEMVARANNRRHTLIISRTSGTYQSTSLGIQERNGDLAGPWNYRGSCAATTDPELALPTAKF